MPNATTPTVTTTATTTATATARGRAAPPPPLDNAGHLRRALDLLELRLRREMLIVRAERGVAGRYDEFAGLVITDEEIDQYLGQDGTEDGTKDGTKDGTDAGTAQRMAPAPIPGAAELAARIAAASKALDVDAQAALAAGNVLRLELVREAFELSRADEGALLACLAPELDLRFERLYAYLQNDVAKRRPCVQLLGRLFPDAVGGTLPVQRLTATEGSLVGLRLLEPVRPGEGAWASRELRLADGLLSFVLESDRPDPELRGVGRWRAPRELPDRGRYYDQHRAVIQRLLAVGEAFGRLPYTYLRAPTGCGKEDLVLALGDAMSAAVLECGADEFLSVGGDLGDWLRVMERDLRLRGGVLWIRRGDALAAAGEAGRDRLRTLGVFLRQRPGVNVVVTGERGTHPAWELLGLSPLEIVLPAPGPGERLDAWRIALGDELTGARPELAEALSSKFKFGPGAIAASVDRALRETPAASTAADTDLAFHRACRAECSPTLEAHAHKLQARYRWDDLVLPDDVLEQLREVRNAVRWRTRVHGDWGFEGKFSLGRGLAVLFSGPSGTGKTMAAEVLAGDLDLDLYKIDLSQVVSKYIGETEKNLGRIFSEAENANGILLFDEADALFGKRSEVKDSHDRYANIEINYLLQRLEEFEGIVILTTNMLKNLDPAFTRRIQYTVEFPVPDEHNRESLWAKVFPAATPRSADLDLDFLAKRFKLSGASIKNVALNSAYLAASNGGVVDMAHLMTALKREYRKMGKLASRSEFGAYYHLVRDDGEPGED
ncbi:MAG: AAA family ATPase [Verrucomicrobiota bacterium]